MLHRSNQNKVVLFITPQETSKFCYIGTIKTNIRYKKLKAIIYKNHQGKGALYEMSTSCYIETIKTKVLYRKSQMFAI